MSINNLKTIVDKFAKMLIYFPKKELLIFQFAVFELCAGFLAETTLFYVTEIFPHGPLIVFNIQVMAGVQSLRNVGLFQFAIRCE